MQNSLLRTCSMLILLLLSIVYALPILYGDDPAVQISSQQDVNLPSEQVNKIKHVLTQAKIPYLSFKNNHDNLLIRFANTDDQIKARDIIYQNIDREQYQVALNIAPKTPTWLQKIGAKPMKLGLDLRGGVHLLVHVDIAPMFKARLSSDQKTLQTTLRKHKIRYQKIQSDPNTKTIELSFRSHAIYNAAMDIIQKEQTLADYQPSAPSTNKHGKSVLHYSLKQSVQDEMIRYTLEQTINTLNNRINELGVSEASTQRQGLTNIAIDLPGIQDTARAKALLGKTATLSFRMVDTTHDAVAASQSGIIPPGYELMFDEYKRPILLEIQPILTGHSITYASASIGEKGPVVSIRLGGGGESLFHQTTARNVGKSMAVIYEELTQKQTKLPSGQIKNETVKHQKIISVATIMSPLGNQFQIDNLQSIQYAENLSLLLRSGALSAPISIVQELTIGASMGQKNIHQGLLSLEIGGLIVILFMMAYYRLFGLVANLALAFNIVLIVMILSLLDATLTLAGIAGIVLTVGMAVDANVLINERIREELRLGMDSLSAIKAGYDRAFSTIVDANVTTLIVALILFSLGSGQVKGFAVTLCVGLVASMITSISFTRMIIDFIYRNKPSNYPLSIGMSIKQGQ